MTQSLQDRVVVVTGGTKGIGLGIAQVFAQAGAKLALLSRNADPTSIPGAISLAADVTDAASLRQAFAAIHQQFGAVDVLCANAGIFPQASLETMTEAEWDQTLDTNLKGTFLTVQAALPYLKRSTQGRIILTSSITGPVTGLTGWAHYGASKAGQLGFLRSAALELAPFGITVNAVMPGNILTEGFAAQSPDHQAAMVAAIPLKRLGSPADIGHAALYFASAEAAYVTGQTLIIDGGQILPESQA